MKIGSQGFTPVLGSFAADLDEVVEICCTWERWDENTSRRGAGVTQRAEAGRPVPILAAGTVTKNCSHCPQSQDSLSFQDTGLPQAFDAWPAWTGKQGWPGLATKTEEEGDRHTLGAKLLFL